MWNLSDMSPQQEIFNQAIERFTAEQEEVRTAAAFAAGNIAVGNLHHFLPLIVKMVENDQEKRLLSLHAIKEVRDVRLAYLNVTNMYL